MISHPVLLAIIAGLVLLTQIGILIIFCKNYDTHKKIFFSNNRNVLVKQLQSPQIREARHYVAEQLINKNFDNDEWDFYDTHTASMVCGAYGTIGAFLNKGKIRTKDIISYKQSIIHCYKILEPYIQSRQRQDGTTYWLDFQQLVQTLKNTNDQVHYKLNI